MATRKPIKTAVQARVYEYEDQYGNVYWTFKKPINMVETGIKLRIRGRIGMHTMNFIDKVRFASRQAANWLAGD